MKKKIIVNQFQLVILAVTILLTMKVTVEYKTLSVEGYLNKIRSYLKDLNGLKKSDIWKIQ